MTRKEVGYQVKEREHFDRLAESIGETYWGNRTPAADRRMRRRASLLAERLACYPDPLVLELGCGVGTFSRYVLAAIPSLRLVGCDISPKAVQRAAERCAASGRARFEVADATALPFPAGTFDAVVGCSILHHLPLGQTLAECVRLLRPGGLLWFNEPNMMNPGVAVEKNIRFIGKITQNTEDETAFFRWSLARALRKFGFADVAVRPYDFLLPLVPRPFVGAVDWVGRLAERVPLVKEFAGCLLITARGPGGPPGEAARGACRARDP